MPREKQMRRYPAALIGRLGVNIDYAGKGIGSELLDFLKKWFVQADNKTGCRYLIVDAYNMPSVLQYYQRNNFCFLFSTEEQEATNSSMQLPLKTRYMYYDLIQVQS